MKAVSEQTHVELVKGHEVFPITEVKHDIYYWGRNRKCKSKSFDVCTMGLGLTEIIRGRKKSSHTPHAGNLEISLMRLTSPRLRFTSPRIIIQSSMIILRVKNAMVFVPHGWD
jgi:hypothetical protein